MIGVPRDVARFSRAKPIAIMARLAREPTPHTLIAPRTGSNGMLRDRGASARTTRSADGSVLRTAGTIAIGTVQPGSDRDNGATAAAARMPIASTQCRTAADRRRMAADARRATRTTTDDRK